MDDASRQFLLRTARRSLAALLSGGPEDPPDELMANWPDAAPRGLFVTLRRGDELRGCIGTFAPAVPPPIAVWEIARAAAQDPRFVEEPVTMAELDALAIEISLLSPLMRTDDPLTDLRLGVHGVHVRRGPLTGCFLPQVATECGWDAERFLSSCCREKAHLPTDAWRDPGTEVSLFEVEHFGE